MTPAGRRRALLLLGAALAQTAAVPAVADSHDASAVARFLGTPFPDGVANLRTHVDDGIDRIVHARFEAPEDAVQRFLDALQLRVRPGVNPFPDPASAGLSWWTPPLSPDHMGAERTDHAANRSYAVLVDRGTIRPDRPYATVFVRAFSM